MQASRMCDEMWLFRPCSLNLTEKMQSPAKHSQAKPTGFNTEGMGWRKIKSWTRGTHCKPRWSFQNILSILSANSAEIWWADMTISPKDMKSQLFRNLHHSLTAGIALATLMVFCCLHRFWSTPGKKIYTSSPKDKHSWDAAWQHYHCMIKSINLKMTLSSEGDLIGINV